MTKIKYRPDLRWIILCAVALPFFSVKANENLEILKDSKKLVFLMFLQVLEVLERSGRLVGTISTKFRQKRSGGLRAMTQNPKKLTTKQVTSINM